MWLDGIYWTLLFTPVKVNPMRFEFNINIHDAAESDKLDQLISLVKGLKEDMANDFSALQAAETAHDAAIADVVQTINDLVTKLGQTPPSDQPTIDALTADITAQTAALAAAATKGKGQ